MTAFAAATQKSALEIWEYFARCSSNKGLPDLQILLNPALLWWLGSKQPSAPICGVANALKSIKSCAASLTIPPKKWARPSALLIIFFNDAMSTSRASYAAKVNEEHVVGLAVVGLRLGGLVVDGLEVVGWDVGLMVGFDDVGENVGLVVVGPAVEGLSVGEDVGLVVVGPAVEGLSVGVDDGLGDVGLVVGDDGLGDVGLVVGDDGLGDVGLVVGDNGLRDVGLADVGVVVGFLSWVGEYVG
jgi:hypothetical protein